MAPKQSSHVYRVSAIIIDRRKFSKVLMDPEVLFWSAKNFLEEIIFSEVFCYVKTEFAGILEYFEFCIII